MTISTLQSTIKRLRTDVAQLEKDRGETNRTEADKRSKIQQIQGSITRTTSASTLRQKMVDVTRLTDAIGQIQKKRSDIEKKLADKTQQLYKAEADLNSELEKERKKRSDAEKRQHQEQLRRQDELTAKLHENEVLSGNMLTNTFNFPLPQPKRKEFDVFVSHATEDKESFVRSLAEQLQQLGLVVWYDEFELKIGDSLRRSIDYGLANSRFGIVILSRAFFEKEWTQYELDGLVAREINGKKVILPIWHNITKDEILAISPTMVDKFALNSAVYTIEEIAIKLSGVIQGDEPSQ